jgi:hypothetical protein
MVQVPPVSPVITPLNESMVATAILLLDHVPPEGDPERVLDVPSHIDNAPVTVGIALTV